MNSTFKVVFNKARGALMVVNEATSSVQAKGTKTVIAAAVTALMAGGAMAANLTYDSIVEEEGTFKFISGGGEETHILTNASVPQLIQELQEAKDLKSFLSALAQVNSEKKTGILLGYAGGQNYMDGSTYTFISAIAIPEGEETVKRILEVTKKQFDAVDSASSLHIDHGTHTIVGTSDSRTSPVVLGLVGSDRVLATGFLDDGNTELVRSGDSVVEVKSGNVIGASIAGSAINVTVATANTTLDGMSRLNVTDTGCIAGAFVGGSAVSILGGKAESLVTDGSQFVLDNKTENSPNGSINTLATGIAGGGLAAGILASANVEEDVVVNIAGGETVGLMGGGAAVWTGSEEAHHGVGVQANVGNVTFKVTGGSVDGLFGGGLALDDSNPNVAGAYVDARNAEANVGNVNINVAGGKVGRLHVEAFNKIDNYPSGEDKDKPDMKLYLKAGLKAIQDGKAAIVGGGMAAGNSIAIAEGGTAKDAAGARVKVANINISGGVIGEEKDGMQGNIYGGGIASTGGTTWVGTSNITVAGGTIHGDIYGGGLSIGGNYGKGHECYNDALSAVDTTNITLDAGSLNGNVYLGGRVLEEGANANNKGKANATVAAGTLTIYKDFKFLKADAVIDGSGADSATLNFVNGYDFSKTEASEVALLDGSDRIVIKGFDKLESGDLVTGADYDMGGKTSVEVTGNYEFGAISSANDSQTLTVKEGGALAVQSTVAPTNKFVVEEGVLALGTTARTSDARDGLGKYNEKAGLYLSGQVNLANASINVGETKAKNGVNIGSNGTLIVDASVDDGQEGNLSTDVTGKITGEKGSTIHYVHVADKGVVEVEHEGFTTVTVDNLLYKVVKVENEDNQYTFKIATGSELAGTGLEHFDGAALDGMADNEVIGSLLDQANTAITSGSQREARLNGALNLATAGGVQTAGIEAATMGIDQATKRAALTNVFLDGWTGFAEVTGTSLKMGGDSGALETKTELGGITVGGEYTMGDMTFGVMGNFGTGDVEGEGDNDGVKNDVDYYGVQGYAAKRMGQFNLVGQMGLMTTKNDVTSADGDSADIDATIFTIGARSEMAFQISKSCQAVPYVGLNYLRVATDGYNTAKGLSMDDMDQNLVSMPIGVAFSGNMDLASGWTLRPTVDVAYVHTFGDTDVEATTKFGAAAINTNLDVWSENVGRVGFGLEARKDALSFGGQIGGAFGDNDHREFYGQLNVKYLF